MVDDHVFVCYGYRIYIFLRFSVVFWGYSDSVVLFVFHFILKLITNRQSKTK